MVTGASPADVCSDSSLKVGRRPSSAAVNQPQRVRFASTQRLASSASAQSATFAGVAMSGMTSVMAQARQSVPSPSAIQLQRIRSRLAHGANCSTNAARSGS